MSSALPAPMIREFLSVVDDRPFTLTVLAPDQRDPSGMASVARVVKSAADTSGPDTPGQWTLTFADDVPGNSARLITSATRRFTLITMWCGHCGGPVISNPDGRGYVHATGGDRVQAGDAHNRAGTRVNQAHVVDAPPSAR